ncbi:MAG: S8 family serine peptidase [Anaerolineaceae bacterium]
MSKKQLLLVLSLIVMLLFSITSPTMADPGETVRVWVNYKEGTGADVLKSINSIGAKVHYDFPELGAYVVSMPKAALNGLLNNPFVIGVEEDAERYPISEMAGMVTSEAMNTIDQLGQTVPYGIDMVQARDVWDVNRDGAVDSGAPTGTNRTLCIIDSGYYQAHEDLPNATGGYSQVDNDWSRDGYGHGSHVGGTIAAENNSLGVVGVTPGTVNLYIVKFFGDDGNATYASNLVDALSRCQAAGANVVSMSLGGSRLVRTEKTAFQNAYNAGVLSIAAAGNDGTSTLSYPASYDSVMSVAAIDSNKLVADFSQYNTAVEIAAPGVGVLSTLPYLETNTLTVDSVGYAVNHIEYSGRGTASGALVNGGLCDTSGAWSGKVVICERGTYDFYTKVMSVQNGGGVAAIIYNNVPGGFLGTLGEGYSSSIVGVSLSQEDGQYLVANKLGQSAMVFSQLDKPASGYEAWDGTSMATPHVSAVAALVWSANTSWTNVQIRQALTASAEDLGAAGRDVYYGYGLVQARAALEYLGYYTTPPVNEAPVLTITSPADGASFTVGSPVSFSATVSDEDVNLGASVAWKIDGVVVYTGASFNKSDLTIGTHVVEASVTDSMGLSDTKQVTITVTEAPAQQTLNVTIVTDKASYVNKESVYVTVTVKDPSGVGVAAATVNVKLTGANGVVSNFTGTTNTSGVYSFSSRLNTSKTGKGTYTLQADVNKTGYLPASASTTFLVQ